jgi:hypothetical protein
MRDGSVAAVGGDFRVRTFAPDGTPGWNALPDSLTAVNAMAVGADSTVFVIGAYFFRNISSTAYRPDGTRRWFHFGGNNYGSVRAIVPADDSTILAVGDSMHALRSDGGRSVRQSRRRLGHRRWATVARSS